MLMNAHGPHNHPAAAPDGSTELAEVGRTVPLHVSRQPISVLLVDDDPDCRLLIRDAIAELNEPYHIYEACNGIEAIDLLGRKGAEGQDPLPGLIFMDVEMPLQDGLETLKKIKSDERLRHIPVVMMTGVSDEDHMRRASAFGANSYTLKPADADAFLTTVAASTAYWLTVHQYPQQRLPQTLCRR